MSLSLLSILLGAVLCVPQIYGLVNPAGFTAAVRRFPRHLPSGIFLMLLGTAWFVWNVKGEPISDFSSFKPHMLVAFSAVGLLSCIFVRDFLAVRGLAIVFLLLAKLMVDSGRPHLGETPFVLVIQGLAYFFVVAGIVFTVAPWKLRDWLEWFTQNDTVTRLGCVARLAFDIFLIVLGFTAFRGM